MLLPGTIFCDKLSHKLCPSATAKPHSGSPSKPVFVLEHVSIIRLRLLKRLVSGQATGTVGADGANVALAVLTRLVLYRTGGLT